MSMDMLFKALKLDNESAERLAEILEHPKPPLEVDHPLHLMTKEETSAMLQQLAARRAEIAAEKAAKAATSAGCE